jgi:hypothetical protein
MGMAFQTLNAVEVQNVERAKITELLEDVSIRLGKTFTLSKEQNVSRVWLTCDSFLILNCCRNISSSMRRTLSSTQIALRI